MQVDQAIETAIRFVKDRFAGEDYRLEEVVDPEGDGGFHITVSFSNAASVDRSGRNVVTLDDGDGRGRVVVGIDASRSYKVVEIAADGSVRNVRVRSFELY